MTRPHRPSHDNKHKTILLLRNQFVTTPWMPGQIWQVVKGWGQGLHHSSECADLSFYNAVESSVIPHSRRYGILLYMRYRDDILVAASNRARTTGVLRFFRALIRPSSWWKIKCEQVGSSVQYLNFVVSVVNSRVVTVPFFKPQKLASVPLCPSSAHSSGVHRSWPAGTLSNYYLLASKESGRVEAFNKFCAIFRDHDIPIPRLPSPIQRHCSTPSVFCKKVDGEELILWLPLAFHPLLELELGKALGRINQCNIWAAAFSAAYQRNIRPVLRIAWRNALPNVESRVRTLENLALDMGG